MEDGFECNSDGLVVGVDRFWVARRGLGGEVERRRGRFDSFVSEDEQRSYRSEPGWKRLAPTGVADAADDLFAAEFLQILRGDGGRIGMSFVY